MAARPPSNDDDDDPGIVEFGIPAVEGALERAEVVYPADAEALVKATGDPEVPIDTRGRSVRLSTALERADRERYENRRDVLNALHPVFEEARESRTGGVVGFVRSLVPDGLR